jgi:NAD(P)-dependent dehydrogenase (short-subunit alcohol dehydrogenase family)
MNLLQDKVCVITGAGSGVGRATAILFATEGAKVVAADINDEWAGTTAKIILDAAGAVEAVHCDVSSESEVAALVATAVERFGRLDVMCNNAGVGSPEFGLRLAEHTQEDWDHLIGINLMGQVYGCKHAVLQFERQSGGGVIVNTGSVGGMVAFGGVPYGVTKAGGLQLTKALAVEVAAQGIRVNAFAPASILTNFSRSDEDKFKPWTEAEIKTYGSFVPTGKSSTAEDCANAALYLASDMSGNVTGTILPVDGGFLAR